METGNLETVIISFDGFDADDLNKTFNLVKGVKG
jgi:hypothetical protein